MDRRERMLSMIDPATTRGVEIGPSFSPIVTKASGADVTVVDHTDADGLREKYRVALTPTRSVVLSWHYHEAVECDAARHWEGVVAHSTEVLKERPAPGLRLGARA